MKIHKKKGTIELRSPYNNYRYWMWTTWCGNDTIINPSKFWKNVTCEKCLEYRNKHK